MEMLPNGLGFSSSGKQNFRDVGVAVNDIEAPANSLREPATNLDNTKGENLVFRKSIISTKTEHCCDLFWKKKHTTITLCCVFLSFGMCVAFLGPTLLDLGCKTSTVFATMSWVFFSQSLSVLLGSVCGGLLLKRFTTNVMLIVGTTVMTITMAIIPFCNLLWTLGVVLAIMGFFMGTIDTVANVSMIQLYGKEVSPFLQALHFFYGVGAFLSPMIVQPFLLNQDCSHFLDNTTEVVNEYEENYSLSATTLAEAQSKTHIDLAFWIMALLMVPVVILSLSLVGRQEHKGTYPINSTHTTSNTQNMYGNIDCDKKKDAMSHVVLVTVLCTIILFLCDGLQAGCGGYIYSYGVKGPAGLPPNKAAFLNALFWGMFAGGRLISIVLATKLSPAFMLLCNFVGCTVGIILIISSPSCQTSLILGVCLLGVFMSSVFPTVLSLSEQYVNITPTITSILVFGATSGEMSLPVIVGHEFGRTGPISFVVIGLVLCFLLLIFYMALWLVGHNMNYSASSGLMAFLRRNIITKMSAERKSSGLMREHVCHYSRITPEHSENGVGDKYSDSESEELLQTR
ncbi:major facilitator superfamily domain-containing protein 4A-like isoform X2 [Limulus polyphemus]|uniref:Major facilitator superfamily domain-containing protein 4A n=1 Tax=Limulus polyphemus TaxID=6850 RepID=A0ABM1SBJ1_LIMPO|nr:major facilitator superfamily domain-containing protein 4A-like isoform X2 [Limulus polyphemus]